MHHGHGGKSPEEDRHRKVFSLRRKTINDYSGPSGLPLILAALPEHQNLS
jgi:hypothetical protein